MAKLKLETLTADDGQEERAVEAPREPSRLLQRRGEEGAPGGRDRRGCRREGDEARERAAAGAAAAAGNFAPAVDWRNRNGNHVTSVKNQRQCGSCVSFCTCAVVESMASIEKGQLLDLSEADSHFCSSHGASCSGWDAGTAYGQFKSRGVLPEPAFAYMSAFDNPPVQDPNLPPGYWKAHCVQRRRTARKP